MAVETMKLKTVEEALENLRAKMVVAMRVGQNFIIDIDKYTPDFVNKYTNEENNFPANIVFDKDTFADPNVHMKMVRDEENKNVNGDKDCFILHENFKIVIVCKWSEAN